MAGKAPAIDSRPLARKNRITIGTVYAGDNGEVTVFGGFHAFVSDFTDSEQVFGITGTV